MVTLVVGRAGLNAFLSPYRDHILYFKMKLGSLDTPRQSRDYSTILCNTIPVFLLLQTRAFSKLHSTPDPAT